MSLFIVAWQRVNKKGRHRWRRGKIWCQTMAHTAPGGQSLFETVGPVFRGAAGPQARKGGAFGVFALGTRHSPGFLPEVMAEAAWGLGRLTLQITMFPHASQSGSFGPRAHFFGSHLSGVEGFHVPIDHFSHADFFLSGGAVGGLRHERSPLPPRSTPPTIPSSTRPRRPHAPERPIKAWENGSDIFAPCC